MYKRQGLDDNPVTAHRTDEEEVSCKNESLHMVPEGTIQVRLGFKVVGEGSTKEFTKDGKRFIARWKDGHFWLSRNDTEELRHLLTTYWRAKRGRSPPTGREERPSFQRFGVLRNDFDKNDTWVHSFTDKMIGCGVDRQDVLAMWDKSFTVQYYSYLCRKKLQELSGFRRDAEESTTGGPPSRVSFSARPVRHTCLEIPVSHHFTHRPKLAGCLGCEQGNAVLTPIVRSLEDKGALGIEGSRIRIDCDWVGRRFPLGSDGSTQECAMQSSEGHFWMIPLKSKDGTTLEDAGSKAIIQAGIDPSMVDIYGDDEMKPLGKWIEKKGGTYNSGIANRSNSHAQAENLSLIHI